MAVSPLKVSGIYCKVGVCGQEQGGTVRDRAHGVEGRAVGRVSPDSVSREADQGDSTQRIVGIRIGNGRGARAVIDERAGQR